MTDFRQWLTGLGAALLLSGCAALGPNADDARPGAGECRSDLDPEQRMAMEEAEQLMARGQAYAALAHLDGLGGGSAEIRLAKAQILSQMGRAEARDHFHAVENDACLRGAARHGLGVLAIREGDYARAAEALAAARRDLPRVAQVRNDYGFVLLMLGRDSEAEFELRSALELSEGHEQPLENLMLLYLSQDNIPRLNALLQRYDVDQTLVARLNERLPRLEQARARAQRGERVTEPVQGVSEAPDLGLPSD
ncbi:tetratricopeptide repeat protein [Alkalilimnicola ehrlichii MLHE-1]|uniref:tetratricopeptide repeat protein n=1 Tax=Alkalilimnicola ehrlichii TaxID=351052 RepID=UPI00031E8396|nr:tetratricopeptide repeat protein [Alkalilimnicola ehrlichii]